MFQVSPRWIDPPARVAGRGAPRGRARRLGRRARWLLGGLLALAALGWATGIALAPRGAAPILPLTAYRTAPGNQGPFAARPAPADAPAFAPDDSADPLSPPRLLRAIVPLPPLPTATPVVVRRDPDDIFGPPSLPVSMLAAVLTAYQSPAAGLAPVFQAAGLKYGIDPVYGLAWFVHESHAGTRGLAAQTYSIGNWRAEAGAPAIAGFASYPSWEASIDDWFARISARYVRAQGLRTVAQIVPRYPGPDDPQDAASVTGSIVTLVHAWRRAAAGAGPLPTDANPIPGAVPAHAYATPGPAGRGDLLDKAVDVSSEFGHYPDGGPHYGLDIRAWYGVPQYAPVGGVVEEVHRGCAEGDAACGRGWGNHIWWRSAVTGHHILLAHYDSIAPGIHAGTVLQAGTFLGMTGATGYATGPHVHIQVNPEAPSDTGAVGPWYEFPWLGCGNPATPHLSDFWGSTNCP